MKTQNIPSSHRQIGVHQEGWPHPLNELYGNEHEKGRQKAKDDQTGGTSFQVGLHAQIDHLHDGIEILIIQVAYEPKKTRASHLLDHQDEGDEAKDADHADEPVQEH